MGKNLIKIKRLINQSEIARRLDIDRSYVSLLLTGKRKNEKRIKQIKSIIVKELNRLRSK